MKRKNRSRDTSPEIILKRYLLRNKLWFRTHCRDILGRPDIVFPSPKVVVFCDGDFWHGRNWSKRKALLRAGANAEYWVKKIRYNVERDDIITRRLRAQGWAVLRFWESDIKGDPQFVLDQIRRTVLRRFERMRKRGLVTSQKS